jgi:WD40 repeat protein
MFARSILLVLQWGHAFFPLTRLPCQRLPFLGPEGSNDEAQEGNPTTFTPSNYFFGPEPFEVSTLKSRDEASADQAPAPAPAPEPAPESAHDGMTNGHPVETGTKIHPSETTNGDEAMEVDEAESKPASPHPHVPDLDGDGDVSMGAMEPEEVPQEPTLSTGSSVGIQISPAKAADLTPDTTLLDEDHVLSASWRPRDPSLLVAAGDTFCSLWKLSSTSAPAQNKFLNLKGTGAYVSTVAWDGSGAKLAVASFRDMKGNVTMYNADGNVVDLLPDLPRVISGLHWAEESPQLVIVASDERTSELALWDDSQRPDVYPPPQVIDNQVYDLAWCGRNQVFACGNGAVYECEVDNNIRLTKTHTSQQADTEWTFLRCAHTASYSVAVTASATKASIWIPTHDILIETAHQDAITAIDIQPQSALQTKQGSSSITIASYSADSTVGVWQVDLDTKQYTSIHRLRLGASIPALTGSFSPDGYALGAVSKDQVFIWNVERGGDPMATWKAPSGAQVKEEPDRATNGQNGHGPANPDRALSWDPDGKKLACGLGNQVC